MSRHYHDSDCIPDAAETIADTLSEIAVSLERIADALERERPTPAQKEDAAFARTAAYIQRHPPTDAIGRPVPK
jgi:hypothetical protein